MLEQILQHIHNFFVQHTYSGKFVISSGGIDLSFLQEGQYFRIKGSVFNDGVYQYPASDLHDEEFSGEIWAMAVPPMLVDISLEIKDWVEANKGALESPYQSESFGGYSYTKASSATTGGAIGWQDVFKSKLDPWRKLS